MDNIDYTLLTNKHNEVFRHTNIDIIDLDDGLDLLRSLEIRSSGAFERSGGRLGFILVVGIEWRRRLRDIWC